MLPFLPFFSSYFSFIPFLVLHLSPFLLFCLSLFLLPHFLLSILYSSVSFFTFLCYSHFLPFLYLFLICSFLFSTLFILLSFVIYIHLFSLTVIITFLLLVTLSSIVYFVLYISPFSSFFFFIFISYSRFLLSIPRINIRHSLYFLSISLYVKLFKSLFPSYSFSLPHSFLRYFPFLHHDLLL